MGPLRITEHAGNDDITPYIPALARLRLSIFKDYPYLYDGTETEEQAYLGAYQKSQYSFVVLAWDGDQIVGASTAIALADAEENFRNAFVGSPYAIDDVYYFGESILDAAHRGQGIGGAFMKRREAHARELGFQYAAFCAVARPENHPLRPSHYRPLDGFWEKAGFRKHPEIVAYYPWKQVNTAREIPNEMVFWVKKLDA